MHTIFVMQVVFHTEYIDKNQCVAYNMDRYRWEVTSLDLDERKIAMIFKAFCDENRIRILKLLTTGEKCACKLLEEIDITQPTMSHHMKILCDSGIVVGRKEGKWMHYSISPAGANIATDCLKNLTTVNPGGENKSCCEKYCKSGLFRTAYLESLTSTHFNLTIYKRSFYGSNKNGVGFLSK